MGRSLFFLVKLAFYFAVVCKLHHVKANVRSNRIPPFLWAAALCMASICASLAWLALTEKQLTTGGRAGISYSEGTAAVVKGFMFLAAALVFLGCLGIVSRFKQS